MEAGPTVLFVCPSCGKRTAVRRGAMDKRMQLTELVCEHCGRRELVRDSDYRLREPRLRMPGESDS